MSSANVSRGLPVFYYDPAWRLKQMCDLTLLEETIGNATLWRCWTDLPSTLDTSGQDAPWIESGDGLFLYYPEKQVYYLKSHADKKIAGLWSNEKHMYLLYQGELNAQVIPIRKRDSHPRKPTKRMRNKLEELDANTKVNPPDPEKPEPSANDSDSVDPPGTPPTIVTVKPQEQETDDEGGADGGLRPTHPGSAASGAPPPSGHTSQPATSLLPASVSKTSAGNPANSSVEPPAQQDRSVRSAAADGGWALV